MNITETIDQVEALADEMAERLAEIKAILKKADRGIYDTANRTWISDIELALGDNAAGWLAKRDNDINATIQDLRELEGEAMESGHTEPEENCEGCRDR